MDGFFKGAFLQGTDTFTATGILGSLNALFQRNSITINNNANAVVTADAIIDGYVNRTGTAGGGFTDTTDTAVNILGYLPPNTPVGWAGTMRYMNNGTGQTATLAPGAGVTIVVAGANANATIGNNNWREFQILVTGSPAQGQTAAVTLTNLGGGTL